MEIRREEIRSFHATDYDFDPASGTIYLRYRLSSIPFEERIELGGSLSLGAAEERAFERVLRLLHAVAGTSYYKAAAPPLVQLESGSLTAGEHQLVADLYDKGLREFAFENRLPIPMAVEVRAKVEEAPDGGADSSPGPGVAVAVGGGKDSIVVVEALRDLAPVLVAVNASPAALRIAEQSGLALVRVDRRLDSSLFELNAGGALNGHVPVTAIVSLAAVAAGFVYGYSTTVMGLEGSADEATRSVGGFDVNHQWSKTTEFENQLRGVLRSISPGIHYGSALRQLSELDIAAAFGQMRGYHSLFRSCNKAFSLRDPLDGWCCNCPKCRFVFLMLATVMDRDALVGIFGKDLFADISQTQGFRDLLDSDRKPFECVGTLEESLTAFEVVVASGRWSGAAVLEAVAPLVGPKASGSSQTGPPVARRSPSEVLETVWAEAGRIAGGADSPDTVPGRDARSA